MNAGNECKRHKGGEKKNFSSLIRIGERCLEIRGGIRANPQSYTD